MNKIVFDGHEILLNKEVPKERTKASNDIGYFERLQSKLRGDLGWKLSILKSIKAIVGDDYDSMIDLMAGLGFSSKIFEGPDMAVNDWNPDCYEVLCDNFPNQATNFDVHHTYFPARTYGLVILDFNKYTVVHWKEWEGIIQRAAGAATRYLMITDSAPFGMKFTNNKLGYTKFFGEHVADFNDYINTANRFYKAKLPKWSLVHVEYFHNCSIFLFKRRHLRDKELSPTRHKAERKTPVELVEAGKGLGQYFEE